VRLFAKTRSTAVVDLLGSGVVQSVFHGAVNIRVGDRLVSVVAPSTGGVPNGIVLARELDLRWLVGAGDVVVCEPTALRFKNVLVDLRYAARWSPRLTLRGAFAPWSTVAPLCKQVRHDEAWTERPLRVDRLVGLGDGLTPAGDDLLVGYSAALRVTGHLRAQEVAEVAASIAPGRTTDLAAMFLDHAARAEYSQRIHTLMDRLVAGPTAADIAAALNWGASSGAATLLGALLGGYAPGD